MPNVLNISYIAPVINAFDIETGKSINDLSFTVEKNSPYECQQTNKIIEQRVGRPVNWIVDYSKVSPPNLSGQYDFYYQGDTIGVDRVGETLDVAEMCGIVEKGGAWYTVDGERFQGRAKAVQ